jgi:hypothetical protein
MRQVGDGTQGVTQIIYFLSLYSDMLVTFREWGNNIFDTKYKNFTLE